METTFNPLWALAALFSVLSFLLLWFSHGHNIFNKQMQQELKRKGYATYKSCKVVKVKNILLIVDSSKEEQCF